jgi:hypothetical protein
MKKIIVALMSFMLIFGSVSYANGLAKQDAELLFGTQKVAKVQSVTLDKSEMAKTDAKGWGWAFRIGAYGFRLAYHGAHHYFRAFGRTIFRIPWRWWRR